MKFIVEIPPDQTALNVGPSDAEAWLIAHAERLNPDGSKPALSHPKIFQRVTGPEFDFSGEINRVPGFAIDLAEGQADLDRASAELRVIEAKAGWDDRKIPLIAFRYPDLASLSDHRHGLTGSERLFALALDEERLQTGLPNHETAHPAPLLYARARLVADARKLECPAYLKPRWSDDAATHHAILQQAKADGFDGMIIPPHIAPLVRNA